MISNSIRSSQRLAQKLRISGFGASITWNQRAPAESTQLALISDTVGKHSTGTPEPLANSSGIPILEALDDPEQHAREYISLYNAAL
jgi:hypothetical protein